jgi:hypothetical protein
MIDFVRVRMIESLQMIPTGRDLGVEALTARLVINRRLLLSVLGRVHCRACTQNFVLGKW